MTAEIAVMNKKAVALAADSAVTIGSSGKIYSSENKLFMLSKYYPVGVMIFSNAQFMGVPWDLLIKVYREELDDKSFDKVEDYAVDFIEWLRCIKTGILPLEKRKQYISSIIYNISKEQILAARDYMFTNIYEKSETDKVEQKDIESAFFDYFHLASKKIKEIKSEFGITKNEIKKGQNIRDIVEAAFSTTEVKISVKDEHYKIIEDVVVQIMQKIITSYTGLVFAGFGEEEYYPSICSYKIGNLYGSKLKYDTYQSSNGEGSSAIIPFAQSEMVTRFIEGIDPAYIEFFGEYLSDIINGYPKEILDIVDGLDDKKSASLDKKISKISTKIKQDIEAKLQELTTEKFINPIISNLDNLPIDELAEMALSLVNITSFKRRVSIDELETVGGPVDVAVITKGDGFIWIKRKHYFDSSNNHHFFNNYYKTGKNE
ncbi:MAG: hypothetical protein JJ892_09035 [Balneola sp.]|nr:hypothetical protein [Balneola sp.]MBO6649651.1 hypothetical protein [Balneola sp.]MBO6712213.1 hypothetical protein [Balneola sp.]MBO6800407.1 hypothetical protein [Balneola sp.]MBO6871801.1 hypothetical protein [Balneola sp.]